MFECSFHWLAVKVLEKTCKEVFFNDFQCTRPSSHLEEFQSAWAERWVKWFAFWWQPMDLTDHVSSQVYLKLLRESTCKAETNNDKRSFTEEDTKSYTHPNFVKIRTDKRMQGWITNRGGKSRKLSLGPRSQGASEALGWLYVRWFVVIWLKTN